MSVLVLSSCRHLWVDIRSKTLQTQRKAHQSALNRPDKTSKPAIETETAIKPIGTPKEKYVCCCFDSFLGACCVGRGGICELLLLHPGRIDGKAAD